MTHSILSRRNFLHRTPQAEGVPTVGPAAATPDARAADSQMNSPSQGPVDFLRRFDGPDEGPHLYTLLFTLWVAWGAGNFALMAAGQFPDSFQHSHP